MKLTYYIDDNPTHYMELFLDTSAKVMWATYVRDGNIQVRKTIDAADVLDAEPSINPDMQIAKKGRIWDFHLIKIDGFGQEHRRSIGVLVNEDLHVTKVDMSNESANDVVLKNYTTHQLDVYNSSLAIAQYSFNQLAGITGVSSTNVPIIELTPESQLKLGRDANVSLELLGEAGLRASELPFIMAIKIDRLAANDITAQHQVEFQLGDNIFKINTIDGMTLESSTSVTPEQLFLPSAIPSSPFVIRLFIDDTQAICYLNEMAHAMTAYNANALIDQVNLKGFCNLGDFSLIDFVQIHALANYREDSIPPEMVKDLIGIAGDQTVLLQWAASAANDLDGYHVYVDGQRHNTDLIKINEYRITDLPNDVPITATVVAVDKSGNTSPSANAITITPFIAPLSTTEFAIPVLPEANSITVSVNPTWTYLRDAVDPNVFHVFYENTETGQSLTFPDVTLKSPDGSGGGILTFTNETFELTAGLEYQFTVNQLNLSGETVYIDTVRVIMSQPADGIDPTKITGLRYVTGEGVVFNALHLVNSSVFGYNVYLDGKLTDPYLLSDITLDENNQIKIPLPSVDWTTTHVFTVTAFITSLDEFGQAEVANDADDNALDFVSYATSNGIIHSNTHVTARYGPINNSAVHLGPVQVYDKPNDYALSFYVKGENEAALEGVQIHVTRSKDYLVFRKSERNDSIRIEHFVSTTSGLESEMPTDYGTSTFYEMQLADVPYYMNDGLGTDMTISYLYSQNIIRLSSQGGKFQLDIPVSPESRATDFNTISFMNIHGASREVLTTYSNIMLRMLDTMI